MRQVSVWVIIFTLDGLQESPLDVERDRSRFTLTDLDPVYASHWGNFGRSAGKEQFVCRIEAVSYTHLRAHETLR